MDALEQESAKFMPIKMSHKIRKLYDKLPAKFNTDNLKELAPEKKVDTLRVMVSRWAKAGIIKWIKDDEYEKTA